MESMVDENCVFIGCSRVVRARGYCDAHYKQLRRGSDLKPIRTGKVATCYGPKCERTASSKGLCKSHYAQLQSGKPLAPIRPQKNAGGSTCQFPECGRTSVSNGLCGTHNSQRKSGKQLTPVLTNEGRAALRIPEMERFWSMVSKSRDCWCWTGAVDKDGYGLFTKSDTKMVRAHRFIYQHVNGTTPTQVDHTCWNHGCVRPEHLRDATPSENGQNRSPASVRASSGRRNVQKVRNRAGAIKYRVIITVRGRPKMFGWYDTLDEADHRAAELRREHYPASQW